MHFIKKLFLALCTISTWAYGQTGDQFVQWSADRKLKWDDYLAMPDSKSDAAANTSTVIGFKYHIRNNVPHYSIFCHFAKTQSWGRYKNDYILSHEQGHFDIAEIFTRKLNKEVLAYEFNSQTFRQDLNKLYTSVMNEKEHFQQQYDRETDFSRNKRMQEMWLKKINQELEKLANYAGYNQNSP